MKKLIRKYALAGFAVLAIFLQLEGQEQLLLPASPGESLDLWTDRGVYCGGEELFYSLKMQRPEGLSAWPWSRVVYLQLVSWNGEAHASVKSALDADLASGKLSIPSDLQSGVYYLRAYTRWMRNYSPNSFIYLPLRIINPTTAQIEAGPESMEAPPGVTGRKEVKEEEELLLGGLQENYEMDREVTLELSTQNEELCGSYSLSIARDLPGREQPNAFESSFAPGPENYVKFYPEVSGAALSGHIESGGELIEAGQKVSLSSYSGDFYFSTTRTNEKGEFSFLLPEYSGEYEFHISVDGREDAEVLIHSEFCLRPVRLPYISFELKDEERQMAADMAVNAQLRERFKRKTELQDTLPAFYGNPDMVFRQADFIELDELEEFVLEVVYNVQIGSYRGEKFMKVSRPSSLIAFPSLVLLDNIPVRNMIALFNLPSRIIDRIEVVERGYILGNEKYHGIISIYSKNRDVVGDEITGASHFFPYQLYQEAGVGPERANNPVPQQNLLFWQPHIDILSAGATAIKFRTPDVPGTYRIMLRSLKPGAASGSLRTATFTVK